MRAGMVGAPQNSRSLKMSQGSYFHPEKEKDTFLVFISIILLSKKVLEPCFYQMLYQLQSRKKQFTQVTQMKRLMRF